MNPGEKSLPLAVWPWFYSREKLKGAIECLHHLFPHQNSKKEQELTLLLYRLRLILDAIVTVTLMEPILKPLRMPRRRHFKVLI